MCIAFVTPIFPYPDSGGRIHTYTTIKKLQKQGHKIFLFTCTNEPVKNHHLKFLAKENIKIGAIVFNPFLNSVTTNREKKILFIKSIFSFAPFSTCKFYSKEIELKLQEFIVKKIVDTLWIDHIYIANYLPKGSKIDTILQSHGTESLLFKRMLLTDSLISKKLFALIEYIKFILFERKYLPQFTKIYAISKPDKYDLERISGKTNVEVLFPQIIPIKYKRLKKSPYTLLFIGYLGWYPNKDGILWFLKEVYPLILEKNKNVKLWIIGRLPDNFKPPDLLGVKFLGYKKNIEYYFKRAKVFIVPIRYGNGIRIKILTALSFGLPIVSTTIGIEGINKKNIKKILISDLAEDFAQKVLSFL